MKFTNSKSDFERDYKKNIRKIFTFKFLTSLHFFSGVLIPFFVGWGKLEFSQVMLLQAIFTFSIFLFEIPTGIVADRYGRKASMLLAKVFVLVAIFMYSIYPNFWLFLIGEILWAIGGALMSGADSALIYDSLKETGKEKKSKSIFAKYGSIGLFGILVSAPLGSFIADYVGVRYSMMFSAVPILLAIIVGFGIKEPKNSKEVKEERNFLKIFVSGFSNLKSHKALRNLIIDYLPVSILSFFIIWSYQVVLESYGVPIRWFGLVHVGLTLGQIILFQKIHFIEKVFGGKDKYLKITPFVIAAGFLALGLVKNVYVAIFAIIVISTFGLTRKQIYKNYFNKHIESHNRATILSFISMIYSLFQAISNIILGKALEWNLTGTFILIALIILISRFKPKLQGCYLLE